MGKYQNYSIDQFECLETIQYLKELGLTLNKIKYHLNTLNLSSIVDSLEYQKHIIDEKINELRQMKEKVDKKIIQIQDATQLDFLEQIRELEFEQRCAICLLYTSYVTHSKTETLQFPFSIDSFLKRPKNTKKQYSFRGSKITLKNKNKKFIELNSNKMYGKIYSNKKVYIYKK